MSSILIMLAAWTLGLLGYFGALTLAGRWLKYRRRGAWRTATVTAIWFGLTLSGFLANLMANDAGAQLGALTALLILAGGEVITVALIYLFLGAGLWRALAGWGMTVGLRAVYLVIMLFGVHQWLVEAYSVPTLAMAPTILSRHAVEVCPKCGGEVLFTTDPSGQRPRPLLPGQSVYAGGRCLNCDFEEEKPLNDLVSLPADRFFVTKFLVPRRWDIVAYHAKDQIYLKRIAGLPGEEISIDKEGHLLIDGKPTALPLEIPHGEYRWPSVLGEPLPAGTYVLGPGGQLRLKSDEYFVLGDNSEQSLDSRMKGPVKRDEIVGVATWIYWPLTRMRILR